MVPAIRAFVRGLLTDSPRRQDAELIVTELATNSLRHTPSGAPGGELSIAVTLRPGWARIAVADTGTCTWTRPDVTEALGDYGRGLLLVEQIADKLGHDITGTGQTMWAELVWSAEGGAP